MTQTALSQEHNLYFLAFGPDIHVHRPQFPTQALSPHPLLILPSQPSRPGLSGYLDPRTPHSTNNLLVQRLGADEVIATVRDDGDVEVVLVRHVLQALARRAEGGDGEKMGVRAEEIRPIFQSNVGISAWGLAIHTEARILAVSSNAHEVRVFKFGLFQGDDAGSALDVGAADATGASSSNTRHTDVTQRVLNGHSNIPAIAFCNTSDDPEARWLLTTDISGYSRAMDLHVASDADCIQQRWRFAHSFFDLSVSREYDRTNAGWGIMFLDRRSFLPDQDFNSAVGLEEGQSLPGGLAQYGKVWDLSETVQNVENNSPVFAYNDPATMQERRGQRRRARDQADSSITSPQRTSLQTDDVPVADRLEALDSSLTTLVNQNEDEPDGPSDPMDTSSDVSDDISYTDTTPHVVSPSEPASPAPTDDAAQQPVHHSPIASDIDEDQDDEEEEEDTPYATMFASHRLPTTGPYFYHSAPPCAGLPCPILHASVRNLYLLQPGARDPLVGFAAPLRQPVPRDGAYLNMFDRLNLQAHIPELGAVVVASQKGRAAVLALTRLAPAAAYPAPVQEALLREGPAAGRTRYAMRIAAIVPFEAQELDNQRPSAPLHGIAAAPVQGLGRRGGRWRLLLYYQDHSVLAYELRGSGGVGEGVLVV